LNCLYRKTTIDEIPVLTELRIDLIKDLHPEFDIPVLENIRKGSFDYFTKHVKNNTYWGYIGLVDSEIVCSAGFLIYHLPPMQSEKFRAIGHVLSFFTKLEHRGKGYGTGLMEFIKISAKEGGIDRLFLNATSMGAPLYKKSGFHEPHEKALLLEL
jgi:GNAT superfamily N-acetyltransferase